MGANTLKTAGHTVMRLDGCKNAEAGKADYGIFAKKVIKPGFGCKNSYLEIEKPALNYHTLETTSCDSDCDCDNCDCDNCHQGCPT